MVSTNHVKFLDTLTRLSNIPVIETRPLRSLLVIMLTLNIIWLCVYVSIMIEQGSAVLHIILPVHILQGVLINIFIFWKISFRIQDGWIILLLLLRLIILIQLKQVIKLYASITHTIMYLPNFNNNYCGHVYIVLS